MKNGTWESNTKYLCLFNNIVILMIIIAFLVPSFREMNINAKDGSLI